MTTDPVDPMDHVEPSAGQPVDVPEPVRARIVALAAQALPRVTTLPPALRRVAEFAPARRARLGGTQIWSALVGDEEFRGHVGTQAAALAPDLAEELRSEQGPDPTSLSPPVDLAALAWLSRPDRWVEAFDAAVARALDHHEERESDREAAEVERLRSRLADAEQAARDQRARLKEQVEALKAENATLRRKLGDTRVSEKAAVEAAAKAGTDLESAAAAAQAAAAAAEVELRRLRARVSELETSVTAARQSTRSERDEGTLRARLLLDTLLDAAQGLRRELALPTVSGAPGDRVEAELAEDPGVRTTSAAGSLGPTSPALLEQFLAMPKARLIIDGYNVSKTAWSDSSLEAQRIRLLNGIAPLVARSGAETTVVFDAAASEVRPPVNPPRGVKVRFSPFGVIADDVIRDLVAAEPQGRLVVVVSSDQEVARDVRRAGARAVSAEALVGLLSR